MKNQSTALCCANLLIVLALHPALSLGDRCIAGTNDSKNKSSRSEDIQTVNFCEMVRNPQLHFDKLVRLTATLEQAEEGQYLSDARCELSHDEQIGVGYADTSEELGVLRRRTVIQIMQPEYGNRAIVTVVGVLRNVSLRSFAWYHYRFDILRFEAVSHVTVPYEGSLQAGITYRAAVRHDEMAGIAFVIPLPMQPHYAVRIEWTNLSKFPALRKMRGVSREQQIVFSVLSDERKQIDVQRWNRTLRCKIISVE
jgi:hypothetical protein